MTSQRLSIRQAAVEVFWASPTEADRRPCPDRHGIALNEWMPRGRGGYGRRVGIYAVMVRRARLRAVAPGVGLAPAS
jgi:hypothetical protein